MSSRSLARIGLALLASAGGVASAAHAQDQAALPFAVGERLSYEGRVRGIGGRGTMWIAGPVVVRGVQTFELHFDFKAKMGPISVSQKTISWLDPTRMAALRFTKQERNPIARHNETVELFPEERRWEGSDGASGDSPTNTPLDELSFIYFIRTLPLLTDSTLTYSRHFDPVRSPTTVRVVGHEEVTTPAGTFSTVMVEMRVRDSSHYRGEGTIRFALTDDRCRIPVRIESAIPDAGDVVLTLTDAGASPCVPHLAGR
ncbi:MAG: DUF3108 domain-containing protein [bacterium]